MHPEDDANGRWSSYSNAESLYKKTKAINTGPTKFLTVHGGTNSGDPSSSGHHMYEGSFEEAANYIWSFIYSQDISK